jgi:hypothetical protein
MHRIDKDFIEGSLETKLIFYRRHARRASQIIDNILRWFEVSDKPGRTHTSDAVAPIKLALQR